MKEVSKPEQGNEGAVVRAGIRAARRHGRNGGLAVVRRTAERAEVMRAVGEIAADGRAGEELTVQNSSTAQGIPTAAVTTAAW
jgi:hypothetical protein